MKKNTKILFICSHAPSVNAPEAGHKTAWRNIERLAVNNEVDVLLVINDSELRYMPKDWPQNTRLLPTISVSKMDKLLAILREWNQWSPRFAVRHTKMAISAVSQAIANENYDSVWLEFTECGCFIGQIPKEIPITISTPDVLIQWALRKRNLYRYLAPATYEDESKVLNRAYEVIAQSSKDADLIRSLYSISNVSVDTPALAPFVQNFHRNETTVVPRSILFWGAMSRGENSRAVLRFLNIHWPVIQAVYPDSILYIVGSNPSSTILARACNQVVVTGFLEDPSQYFRQAAIGVAPLEEGAGIKVKVLEMVACGIHVISTPVGAEGIQPQVGLQVCEFNQISNEILRCWAN